VKTRTDSNPKEIKEGEEGTARERKVGGEEMSIIKVRAGRPNEEMIRQHRSLRTARRDKRLLHSSSFSKLIDGPRNSRGLDLRRSHFFPTTL